MIVILGAGVTGLAAGYELLKSGCTDFRIFEAAPSAGGLSGSSLVEDQHGLWTWDHGGHVVFSHYGEFDRLLEEVMRGEVNHLSRTSYVYMDRDTRVPYPFQDHPRYLNLDDQARVVEGLVRAGTMKFSTDDPPLDLWAINTLGKGVYDLFYEPYNRKVWSTELRDMSSSWVRDRVSTPDWRKALANISTREDTAWGPNATFAFPKFGGTGEIWRRLADLLDDYIVYESEAVRIDPLLHYIWMSDGELVRYEKLISTMPLDKLARRITGHLIDEAFDLRHNSVLITGIGATGSPESQDWSWAYFPQPKEEVPFYRVTNFTRYSRANTPSGYASWMCETSFEAAESTPSPVFWTERVEAALRDLGIVEGDEVAHRYTKWLPYAYPVPTLSRDRILQTVQPRLEQHGILSRGRFGAWRYEAGNQDHSAMQGLEAARRALYGTPETVVTDASL